MMVVLGLVGVAAMGVLQITSNMTKASKTSEIGMEVNATVNSITQNLLNSDACKNTFQGIGAIRDNLTIPEIKNRTGQTLFDKVKKLGNNRLKIDELTINGVTIKPAAPGVTNSYGEFKLQIKLEKLGKGYHGQQFVTKSLPLQGEFDPSKNLVKCYSSTEDAVYTAKKQSCEDVGGTWDIPSDSCNLSSSRGRTIAASTEDLGTQMDDLKNNYLKDNYVNKAGDTMTGDLTISGKNLSAKIVEATDTVKASTQVCIGTNCRNFEKKECNKGDVTLGINPDGSPICVSMLCADGYYFEKLDSSTGNPVCKPIPTGTCPANTYVSEVKTDGTVTCSPLPTPANRECPTGKYITKIASDGSITCDNPNVNSICMSPHYVSGFDSNGKMKCTSPAQLKLKFECKPLAAGTLNSLDGAHHLIQCDSGYFLRTVTFGTASDHMDNIANYTCCKAELYYDPADSSLTAPSMNFSYAGTWENRHLNSNSDNQTHDTKCQDVGGQFLVGLQYWANTKLDELESYLCGNYTASGVKLKITKRTVNSGYNTNSDSMGQVAQCNSDEFLERIPIYATGGLDYLQDYTCAKLELE